jgi:hypothetical protein
MDAAFGREGLRDLLHLNPIEFSDASEVLVALATMLKKWTGLSPSGIRLELQAVRAQALDGHPIRTLRLMLSSQAPHWGGRSETAPDR